MIAKCTFEKHIEPLMAKAAGVLNMHSKQMF